MTPGMEERMLEAKGKSPQRDDQDKGKRPSVWGLWQTNLDARPCLLTEPESLLEDAWESPAVTPGGGLELLKAFLSLAGGHQEVNAFKGEGERGTAWSWQRKIAQCFIENILPNKNFPNWQECSKSGAFGSWGQCSSWRPASEHENHHRKTWTLETTVSSAVERTCSPPGPKARECAGGEFYCRNQNLTSWRSL